MAIASLAIGITSIVFSCIPYVNILGVLGGVAGIILAVLSRKIPTTNSGIATAGLVCSIVAVALGTILFFACTVTMCVSEVGSLSNYRYYW